VLLNDRRELPTTTQVNTTQYMFVAIVGVLKDIHVPPILVCVEPALLLQYYTRGSADTTLVLLHNTFFEAFSNGGSISKNCIIQAAVGSD
jgi:hypothetical protein